MQKRCFSCMSTLCKSSELKWHPSASTWKHSQPDPWKNLISEQCRTLTTPYAPFPPSLQQRYESSTFRHRCHSLILFRQASRFAFYETFCTGHPEALDLVRKSQTQRPLEWQAFEQHCSSLVHESGLTPAGDLEPPEPTGFSEESDAVLPSPIITKKRNRAASLSSIDGSVRSRVRNLISQRSLSR